MIRLLWSKSNNHELYIYKQNLYEAQILNIDHLTLFIFPYAIEPAPCRLMLLAFMFPLARSIPLIFRLCSSCLSCCWSLDQDTCTYTRGLTSFLNIYQVATLPNCGLLIKHMTSALTPPTTWIVQALFSGKVSLKNPSFFWEVTKHCLLVLP